MTLNAQLQEEDRRESQVLQLQLKQAARVRELVRSAGLMAGRSPDSLSSPSPAGSPSDGLQALLSDLPAWKRAAQMQQ
jgi:hypothetical protein